MPKTPAPLSADDAYQAANCSALLGVFFFKNGPRVAGDVAPGEPVQFCVGERVWQSCPQGLPDALAVMAAQMQEYEGEGRRPAEMPEDWGVIANLQGEVTHRAMAGATIRSVEYLGRHKGPLATGPVTIEEIGIAPPSRPKLRAQR